MSTHDPHAGPCVEYLVYAAARARVDELEAQVASFLEVAAACPIGWDEGGRARMHRSASSLDLGMWAMQLDAAAAASAALLDRLHGRHERRDRRVSGQKFYIATRLERAAAHNDVRDKLRERGYTITYDWTAHGSVQREGPERIREVALAETGGVRDADFVVVLLPGGRGTHAELGLALAFGKRVFICGDPEHGFFAQDERTCAFYHHPLVSRHGTLDGLLAAVDEWARKT